MNSRRSFLHRALAFGAGVFAIPTLAGAESTQDHARSAHGDVSRRYSSAPPVPVVTQDLSNLPYTMDGSVKVFHLVAEPVKQEILPGTVLDVWGYNGSAPGPTIQVNNGDRVRIVVDNHLPEPTSMHWHGLEIPFDMDGGPGVSQAPIKPGGRFVYEFTLHQEGTFFYHSHMAMQEMMGMLGAFILHPRQAYRPAVDKDYVIALQEYAVLPSNSVPNSMNMEFNWLVLNGKTGPAVTPLVVRLGDRVRIRLINLGMDHHPIHLHGNTFEVTGTEGGRVPESARYPGNTVLVAVAQSRDIEFVANNPGDWMLHCHLPHHMMNQMSSNVGPMTRSSKDTPAGVSMENGMGMLTGEPGAPMGDDYGPSLGRGMGVGATNNEPTSNGPQSQASMAQQMQDMPGMNMNMMPPPGDIAANANSVPGFPQDVFMEGPMMAMDAMVAKPENYGLPAGWSGFMQGMMTFVRVLPPEEYEEVLRRVERGEKPQPPEMPGMKMDVIPNMKHRM